MVKSPKVFDSYKGEHYIHRFRDRVADTGLRYESKVKTVYVQLDKCLEQFKRGVNAEGDDRLQLLLAMIADANDEQVMKAVEQDEMLAGICAVAKNMARDKEPFFVRDPAGEGIRTRSVVQNLRLEEPCFVLDPEGERLQNRHPDRVGIAHI